MTRVSPWRLLLAIAVIALTVSALCGCSGSSSTPEPLPQPPSGQVAGHVLYFTTDQGLGGVDLTVGGKTDTSDNNGDFLITGITPGDNQVLTVDPPAWLALPSQDPIHVDVALNQTTTLPQPIRLINSGDVPPAPPS